MSVGYWIGTIAAATMFLCFAIGGSVIIWAWTRPWRLRLKQKRQRRA